jgi:dsDNA-specific endonuclease/ATPase MutS2
MRNIAEMAERASRLGSYSVMSGTGTDPDEGARWCMPGASFIARATTIATTTQPAQDLGVASRGVLNASGRVRRRTRGRPRPIIGVAGASAGLDIAQRMDLPSVIIDKAATLMDPRIRKRDYRQLKNLSMSRRR